MGYAPGWQIRCRKCGLKVDASQAFMIRIGAVGKEYTPGKCQACNRLRLLVIENRTDPNAKAEPSRGYAPGWRVRCPVCGKMREAEKEGLIITSDNYPKTIVSACMRCGEDRPLVIERGEVEEA